MKRSEPLFLSIFLWALFCVLVFPTSARAQTIFDLVRKGEVPAVKALLDSSPQLVDARDDAGNSPLHYAASSGDAGLIGLLLDMGAKLEAANASGKTPLHVAAQNDRLDAAAALIKRGAALEARDSYLRTALILCARERGQTATARLLLEAGANVDAVDKFDDTALNLAAWRGKADLVDLLLAKGAKLPADGRARSSVVSSAVSHGVTSLFRRLTDDGRDLKAVESLGPGLLTAATMGGSAEIVGILIDKGYAPARADGFGWTPLHYAALFGRTEAARTLLDRGAPLDPRNLAGQTAYNVAVERKMDGVAGLLAAKGADTSPVRFPVIEGDYLGQKPPGDAPELFAPGIVSSIWGLHSTTVFSPDGNELFWSPMVEWPGSIYSRGGLMMMTRVNGRWTAPAAAPFTGPDDGDVPFFSQDGKRIYFISRRPRPGAGPDEKECIWYADRTSSGWSEPRPLDPALNDHPMHWSFSLDRAGNLYFAGQAPGGLGMDDIYVSRLAAGKHEKPVNLGPPISTAAGETTPFVAPDGSYLLFSRQYDLWVSFRAKDGSWTEPVNLGPEVNGPSIELAPFVTADGKYLFFLSQRGGESHAYWVGAGVLARLKAKALGPSGAY